MRIVPTGIQASYLGIPSGLFASAIMYDCGGYESAVRRSLSMVPNEVSLLILSHLDFDHISGVPMLLAQRNVGHIWMPAIGDELRLCLAADTAVRSFDMGYAPDEVRLQVRFAASPRDYLDSESITAELHEVPPFEPREPPADDRYPLPVDQGDSSGVDSLRFEPFSVEFVDDAREVHLIAGRIPWFHFKVLINGTKDAIRESRLKRYLGGVAKEIDMSPGEMRSDLLVAADRISKAAELGSLRKIGEALKLDVNDTSMVVGAKPSSFSGSMALDEVSILSPGDAAHLRGQIPLFGLYPFYWPRPVRLPRVSGHPLMTIQIRGWSALLTGDIGKAPLRHLGGLNCPILQVPHHGSRYSLSEEFYRRNAFEIGIISHGNPSPYPHPHPSVVKTLLSNGVRVLSATQQVSWTASHTVWDF